MYDPVTVIINGSDIGSLNPVVPIEGGGGGGGGAGLTKVERKPVGCTIVAGSDTVDSTTIEVDLFELFISTASVNNVTRTNSVFELGPDASRHTELLYAKSSATCDI